MARQISLWFATVVLLKTATLTHQACNYTSPCKLKGGLNFTQPPHLVSSNGFLKVNFNLEVTPFTVDWLTLYRRSYNKMIPGPTWRVKAGDTVNLTLTDLLTYPEKTEPNNGQRFPNSTNIHTHGMHISGEVPHDNVFIQIYPNNSHFDYNYPVETAHPSGTYWYHPHLHGSVEFQTHGGMGGMIIVEDPTNASTPQHLQDVSCPNHCENDVQLVMQPTMLYSGGGFAKLQISIGDNLFMLKNYNVTGTNETLYDWMIDPNNGVNNFTTNGLLNPIMYLPTGQTKRFRLVNAGGGPTLELFVIDANGNPACEFYEIAWDGVYLDKATPAHLGKSFIVPSAKVDWLIVCNNPGTFYLTSLASPSDDPSIGNAARYNGTLLTLSVSGSPTNTTINTTLPARPWYQADFRNATQSEVHGRFMIEAASPKTLNRDLFSNGTYWRYKVELNTLQEWYLTNTGTTNSHPIHIHVNSFQVISYNPYTGPFDGQNKTTNAWKLWDQKNNTCFYQHSGYNASAIINIPSDPLKYLGHDQRWAKGGTGTLGYSNAGVYRDTLLVPPLSNITIRFMTNKYLGDVTIHCHILGHEDSGMMMVTDIVNQGANLTANVKSGNAYPGTCQRCDPFPPNNGSQCLTTTPKPLTLLNPKLSAMPRPKPPMQNAAGPTGTQTNQSFPSAPIGGANQSN